MGRNDEIPVPAHSLRTLAQGATDSIQRHREAGRKASARSAENAVAEVMDAVQGKDGEFASVNGSVVSTIAAEGISGDAPDVLRHTQAVEVYLEKYGVW